MNESETLQNHRIDVADCVRIGFARYYPLNRSIWLKVFKADHIGAPSAIDACPELETCEAMQDANAVFWRIKSDDLIDAVCADVIARPAIWCGRIGDDGEAHLADDDEKNERDLIAAVEQFLSDFTAPNCEEEAAAYLLSALGDYWQNATDAAFDEAVHDLATGNYFAFEADLDLLPDTIQRTFDGFWKGENR